jgi:hypothetical protein
MATTPTSHPAYRRIHLDLHLTQGCVCHRMCCHASHSDTQTITQEQIHDRHHYRRDPRRQPLHP